jgi:arylsulfatase A-like enzyme
MDTTRADHLSCYGYERKTTPHIDRIAKEGVLFTNVISPSSWTLPSHASMFTGLFPSEHKADHLSPYLFESHETLAEILKREGYKTLAYSNNPWVSLFTGLSAGFDNFQEGWREGNERYFYKTICNALLEYTKRNGPASSFTDHGAARTNRYVTKWIEKNKKSPFFVFINYLEPHLPYNPPFPFNSLYLPTNITPKDGITFSPRTKDIRTLIVQRQRISKELAVINGLYDGEIKYLDEKIWELYEHFRKLNILDNTLLIITSDHGENLGDHGVVGHAFGLFNTLLDVHLIARYPKVFKPGLVIHQNVQTTDIFYTALDAIGLNSNPSKLGLSKSLIKRIKTNDYQEIMIAERDRPINTVNRAKQSAVNYNHIDKKLTAIILRNYKYIQSSGRSTIEELYNLNEDIAETNNILYEHPDLASFLRNRLTTLNKKLNRVTVRDKRPQMDQETKENLRSLGYIK